MCKGKLYTNYDMSYVTVYYIKRMYYYVYINT